MDPIDTYAALYDEVLERENGKDLYSPEFGTVWDRESAAAQRMARKRDEDVSEAIDRYVESVEAFDETQRLLTGPRRHRKEAYKEALPTELVDESGAADYLHVETDDGEYKVSVEEWITMNVEPIVQAEDARAFKRKLRNNVQRIDDQRLDGYRAKQLDGLYDHWRRQDVAWGEALWAFVTDDELGVKELAEERRRHNREIAAHAQHLQEALGAHLDTHAQASWLERLKDRLP